MKKTIRLNESDLSRIVRRIIKEEEEGKEYRGWGHDSKKKEDAADKIAQMWPNISHSIDEIVEILYKSGLMSYEEAMEVGNSFGRITRSIIPTVLNYQDDWNYDN